jgi:hypothetical protein
MGIGTLGRRLLGPERRAPVGLGQVGAHEGQAALGHLGVQVSGRPADGRGEVQVCDLKAKGGVFEIYDMPGVGWDGEIATLEGLGRAAWFKDSEGNVMCIDQEFPAS